MTCGPTTLPGSAREGSRVPFRDVGRRRAGLQLAELRERLGLAGPQRTSGQSGSGYALRTARFL